MLMVLEPGTFVVGEVLSPERLVCFGHGILHVCDEVDEFRLLFQDGLFFARRRPAVADLFLNHAE
jgi:hypothetical protein